MPITRHFLDVARPALSAVADDLLSRYRTAAQVDLGNTIVVVPGRRAGRRMLEILVDRAQRQSLLLTPPDITTEGTLPERLYRPKRPFAGALTQELAWAKALRSLSKLQFAQIAATRPHENDAVGWMELGRVLKVQHIELAAGGLDFADVEKLGSRLSNFDEAGRWKALHAAQQSYLGELDRLGLWDVQTARLVAIQQREIQSDKDIVLLGTVDLNGVMRQMLDQVETRVTAFIHAPDEWSERFDAYGCVLPRAWLEADIQLHDEQIERVDGPSQQADAVTRRLAQLDGRYRTDEITIGVTDESIVPQIQRQLLQCSLPSRWVIGKMLSETAPYRLLSAVADYLERGRFHDFAALVRHSDVDNVLREEISDHDYLTRLDLFYNERLSSRLDRNWDGGPTTPQTIRELHLTVKRLLARLPIDRLALDQWAEPIAGFLIEVYGRRPLDREDPIDREVLSACKKIHDVLAQHRTVPEALAPELTAAEAIRLTLAPLQNEPIPSPADGEAIELLGWLELTLDDAPVLIVTSFNEGLVPKSVNADAFLPNELRRHLGLLDNDRRYARDAYALSVLAATRKELSLIVARRNAEGNPLQPSRLLFATDSETVAHRSLMFFETLAPAAAAIPRLSGGEAVLGESAFGPRQPPPLAEPITEMAVTSFKTYLDCPYRYYLSRVLKLAALLDAADELDAATFGTLLHEVLNRFGGNEAARELTDSDEIYSLLSTDLDQTVEQTLGTRLRAAVGVQIEQLRLRLKAFAAWQARRTLDGWCIEFTETTDWIEKPALTVDGRPMYLRGRIDRIDVHRQTGRRIIFDYKSGDTAKSPEQTHRSGGQWIDLQLPLYRHLARSIGIDGPVELGYIVLPKDTTKTGHLLAAWSEEDLRDAEQASCSVVRSIRDNIFWPPKSPPPRFSEDFAPICQDRVFGRLFSSTEEEDAA